MAVAALLSAGVLVSAGVAHAESGQLVHLVNNSSSEFTFDGWDRFFNIADRSQTIAPGATGFVLSTAPADGSSFTYIVGDTVPAPQSVYITTVLEDGAWITKCYPSDGLLCTIDAPQGNWPRTVTIADRPPV